MTQFISIFLSLSIVKYSIILSMSYYLHSYIWELYSHTRTLLVSYPSSSTSTSLSSSMSVILEPTQVFKRLLCSSTINDTAIMMWLLTLSSVLTVYIDVIVEIVLWISTVLNTVWFVFCLFKSLKFPFFISLEIVKIIFHFI